LGTVVEFPRSAHRQGSDAVLARRVRGEETVPRLNSDRSEIIGNGGIEMEFRRRIRAHDSECCGYHCRGQHNEYQYTTHPASLPTIGSGRRSQNRVWN
jgi:hypothetical protein